MNWAAEYVWEIEQADARYAKGRWLVIRGVGAIILLFTILALMTFFWRDATPATGVIRFFIGLGIGFGLVEFGYQPIKDGRFHMWEARKAKAVNRARLTVLLAKKVDEELTENSGPNPNADSYSAFKE